MSDSVRPHRQQPTRLRHPWDSPGKNTGVGCHFLLQFMKVKSEGEVTQSCLTLCDPMDYSTPGIPGLHYLSDLAQTHIHRFSDENIKVVFLPGESQGWRSLVGGRLWGRTESDTTEET